MNPSKSSHSIHDNDNDNIDDRIVDSNIAKADFSYLTSKLSPVINNWEPLSSDDLNKHRNLNEFVEIHSDSSSVNLEEEKNDPTIINGTLESTHKNNKLTSSVEKLQINEESDIQNDIDYTNNTSSFLNSSVPTQFLKDENINDENHIHNLSNTSNDRIQSTTSSVYSALPQRSIPETSHLGISQNSRIYSTTSSVYSELPNRKTQDLNKGMKSFRISSLNPALHNNNNTNNTNPTNDNNNHNNKQKHPRQSFTNRYESVAEDEPLEFKQSNITHKSISEESPTKTRVSVLNQSLFSDQYKNKNKDDSKNIQRNSELSFTPSINNDSLEFEDEDASALFVSAIYAFNAESLESENDSSICLSFDQDEIAFTYNLDDSGWGEVTLLSSLKRGWVPMNYFRSTVVTGFSKNELNSMKSKELANTRAPLKLLLKHAGKFLLNPQSKPVSIEDVLRGYTFDVECFNGITDGIRKLLVDTDCISRSNYVVQNKPVVRKMRKKLLRGWADLIAKGKEYMGTISSTKIEYLQLLTFHLLQKAITFLDIWGLEQDNINSNSINNIQNNNSTSNNNNKQAEIDQLSWNDMESVKMDITYLDKPPILSYRINEVYNQLITYLCLISGRIDLVEHNPKSFSTVGLILGHINLLFNEYFFIINLLKTTMNEQESETRFTNNMKKYPKGSYSLNLEKQIKSLNFQTEKLRQMVEELNTYIRILHDVSKKDLFNRKNQNNQTSNQSSLYFYSHEAGAVVVCSSKMIELTSNAYYIMKNLFNLKDMINLPNSRRYPNYLSISISPETFIKKCTNALITNDTNIQEQVNKFKRESTLNISPAETTRASKRFSIFKAGNSTDIKLSSAGLEFLSSVDTDNDENTFLSNNKFQDNTDDGYLAEYEFDIEKELIRSEKDNRVIGASFRALVHLLTDEINPPTYFFISTFFLTFRIFSDSAQLLEALINRFDVNNSYKRINNDNTMLETKIRSRRKLVMKFFRTWLESYWKPESDYVLLAPLINFFNEGTKEFLPIESYQLLVTASKLIGNPPTESNNDKLNYYNNISNSKQLLPRKISSKLHQKTISKMSLGINSNGLLNEIEAYNSFMDDIETYELEKLSNDTLIADNSRISLNLSLNIELKKSKANTVLLTKQQTSMIKLIIMSYRRMLGRHWFKGYIENEFEPLDTKTLIDCWWNASQESWKILNDDLTLLNFNGLEIAKQLTLIESKFFCSIQIGELLNQNFTTKKLHLNLSPNIQKSVLFTNLLSEYVIESILKPNLQMHQRIHAFKCWLKIGISCLYLRNFNSLASIMTSLQSFLITRINRIWDGLSDKYKELFNFLASIIHPNRNYNSYRERLREFLQTNTQENIDIPIVPYLSLFLQDLTFIVDGNPNYRNNDKSFLGSKLINVDKYSKITEIISDLQTLQISYKDTGDLGNVYNNKETDIVRSETIKNLRKQFLDNDEKNNTNINDEISFEDMFDINGVPILQELILLEVWKVKQTNARDDDRSWKLSCMIQPRETEQSK
mgnify:FL=1